MNYKHNPEIWGGLECTINRVGDTFRNQLQDAGHYERKNDIEKIAQLGIRKLRYPILWEAHQFASPHEEINWRSTKKMLAKIRSSYIAPIAGLVHHGSGPVFTDLLDVEFPEKLAAYAAKVATEFPWIEYYTPVNEPLTTARFSGLYGFWYPHHTNELSFARILLNEIKAVVLAMHAIKKINPNAKLVQTEDLAKTHSTPLLKYQADFENQRRWLTYDLLCGKVNRDHFFWHYFISLGIDDHALQFFLDQPCVPDIVGFNYYVTSERYLDENTDLYHENAKGGNGVHVYSDIDAVRTHKSEGLRLLLKEAWNRYHLPMALTEVHINCTREEQLRWFTESWDSCTELMLEQVDIKAVTAWSLLGAFDWNSLLTRQDNMYESGAFEINRGKLRPTLLAKMICSLSETGYFTHHLIESHGWWRCDNKRQINSEQHSQRPLIFLQDDENFRDVTIAVCERRGLDYFIIPSAQPDAAQKDFQRIIAEKKPWAIVISEISEFQQLDFNNLDIPVLIFCGKEIFKLERKYPEALLITSNVPHRITNEFIYSNPLKNSGQLFHVLDNSLNLLMDQEK